MPSRVCILTPSTCAEKPLRCIERGCRAVNWKRGKRIPSFPHFMFSNFLSARHNGLCQRKMAVHCEKYHHRIEWPQGRAHCVQLACLSRPVPDLRTVYCQDLSFNFFPLTPATLSCSFVPALTNAIYGWTDWTQVIDARAFSSRKFIDSTKKC